MSVYEDYEDFERKNIAIVLNNDNPDIMSMNSARVHLFYYNFISSVYLSVCVSSKRMAIEEDC